ncbi:aldehyde dehydrogenase [Hyaloscypha variabilis]
MATSASTIKESSKGLKRLDFTTFANVINGNLVTTAKTRHGINPATKTLLPEVPIATAHDLDEAVSAARVAFRKWSKTPLSELRAALEAFAVALKSYESELARPAWIRGINKIQILDEVIEEEDRKVYLRYTPLGVVGAIVSWNFPIQTLIGKIAPALVTGNTIIVKPSPFTPYCALKIVELGQQFFPPGVLQGLSGGDSLGPWMTAHPNIDKISFTDSTATGKKVMEGASKTLKRLTLELGGKDPAIICKDVNIALVAPKIAELAFLNSGQICIALKRIYIHESIYAEFRAAMVEATKKMKVGDGFTNGVFLGPIQNEIQYDRVRGFFDDIEKEGQCVAVGGIIEKSTGYFIKPTIIDNPAETSRLVLEEPLDEVHKIWEEEANIASWMPHTLHTPLELLAAALCGD